MATTTWTRRTPSAGGKIVKNRNYFQQTPYSRPSIHLPENPNWISGFLKPAKLIVSGASKFVSFFGNDVESTSSSESDDDDDDDEIENDMSVQEGNQSDKVLSPSNKSENKRAIEHLVMQETYSRKEANELIKLIRSRIDTSGNIDEATPNIRSTAIMEARRWLEEKRSASNKKLENELDVSNMASPSQISRNEKGSPVDIARSYMQSRPVWASSKVFEAGSSPFGVLHFNEETPKSTLRTSELKKSSFNSGSWNLFDEIRRVRSKATQEILAASPLTKTNISPFSTQSNQPQDILTSKGLEDSKNARCENVTQDASATPPLRVNQDNDAVKPMELQDSEETAVLKYNDNDEVNQLKSTTTENGFDFSASGLVQGQGTTHETQPLEEETMNLVVSSQGEGDTYMENLNPREEEQATDIPNDTAINGSQNSSSMQEEELSQDFNEPVTKPGPLAKAEDEQNERKPRGRPRKVRGRGK